MQQLQQPSQEFQDALTLYRADIQHLASQLSPAARTTLLGSSHRFYEPEYAPDEPLPQTREVLIERSLWLPIHLACRTCQGWSFLWGIVSDLVQEGNVGLLKAVNHAHTATPPITTLNHIFRYAATYVHMEQRQFLFRRKLIPVHYKAFWRARQSGDEEQIRALARLMAPASLDQQLPNRKNERTMLDYLGDDEDWPDDEEQAEQEAHRQEVHARVEALLAPLPDREQQVLRLRYGLHPDDQRAHSHAEVAARLGIDLSWAKKLEKRALARLRGEPHRPSRRDQAAAAAAAREARLLAVYQEWRQQGRAIGILRLSQAAQCSTRDARAFLQAQEGAAFEHRVQQGIQKRTARERLQAGQAQLQAQDQAITVRTLSQVSHTSAVTAHLFLQEQEQGSPARRASNP
jgi:RNA polymerase sigma factor (sigma-70 family)